MASTMHLDVVSAEESIYSGTVQEVIAPGSLGDLGIMPGHSQLITTLKAGEMRYKTENKKTLSSSVQAECGGDYKKILLALLAET